MEEEFVPYTDEFIRDEFYCEFDSFWTFERIKEMINDPDEHFRVPVQNAHSWIESEQEKKIKIRCTVCGTKEQNVYTVFNDAGTEEPFCGRGCCRKQVHFCIKCQQYSNSDDTCNNPKCSKQYHDLVESSDLALTQVYLPCMGISTRNGGLVRYN